MLTYILLFLGFLVLSEEGIYVSRFNGHDTKTCGKVSSPCRTISYGLQQLSTGLYIYLDGTDTLKYPYACEALDLGHSGIYLNKSASFVSIKSRAHISCLHGNPWLVNGTKHKHGIQISFSGLAFLNTSVRLFDAFVAINNTIFAETEHVSLYIEEVNRPRFDLSLNNVVFKKNLQCLTIFTYGSNVFMNITNTVFTQNGNPSSDLPLIHSLNLEKNLINIELKNCSFKKNTLKTPPMILVVNKLGTTNVWLSQFQLEETSQTNPSFKRYDATFRITSPRVILSLEYGYIFKIPATFLSIVGESADINISNMQVNGFCSSTPGGGLFDVLVVDSCSLWIKDSSFRNGKNNGSGGIVSISALNSTLTIQNSTIHNVSSSNQGGAVCIVSYKNVHLRIINASFSNSASNSYGGVVFVVAKELLATVCDNLFLRNSVTISGSILSFITNDRTSISLHNNIFQENRVDNGGIVHCTNLLEKCSLNFSMTNVLFVKNRVCKSPKHFRCGIVMFTALCVKINISFQNLHFIRNSVQRGSCLKVFFLKASLHFDTCIFKENIGLAMIFGGRDVVLTCKNSIFDSNRLVGKDSKESAVMFLNLQKSTTRIMNTTFVNNIGRSFVSSCKNNTRLIISDSAFVRNKIINGTGTLVIMYESGLSIFRFAIMMKRVLFQENSAPTGSVLYINRGTAFFVNCTFLNNFALPIGGVIFSGLESSVKDSANLVLYHSVFRQTMKQIVINNSIEFTATSFLRQFGSGSNIIIANTTFDQQTKSHEPLILITAANGLSFDKTSMSLCPLGHAIEKNEYIYTGINENLAGLTFSCKECDYNSYSLQRGTARGFNVDKGFQCLPCPRGADCVPAIKSKTNYWGYHVSLNPPKLSFTICPFGYCKSPPTNSTEYNACQGKRNGVMCGMCSKGYTEALWSTYCTPVTDCNDHWFWILFLALVFSMATILVFKPPFVTYCLKQIFWFRTSSRTANTQVYDDIVPSLSLDEETPQENIALSSTQHKQDKRQFSRFVDIIFYFYQIAQLLLSSSSLKEFFVSQFLKPILGFFNFQPSFTKQGFLCPFPGLTPETKLVFKIAPVFGTLIAIFFIYALHSFICRTKGSVRPAIAPYLQASIKTVFLGYATLATVSISLIRCVVVADESRWFYNGNIACYQWWQYASFIFIAIFVIPFVFVITLVSFKLHHNEITVRQFLLAIIFPLPFLVIWLLRCACSSPVANVEESQNVNALKEMLLAPYRQPDDRSKRGAFYWQSVLIGRRFILVVIFCIVTEPSIRLFCMTIVCVVILYCHVKVRPFQNSLANNLESLSLFFLIILGLVNLFKSVFVGSEQNIKGSLITVLKVFQWLETVMLGLFPAVLLLLLSFAVISFSLRVLVVCCRSIFKFFIRPCAQRWMSRDTMPLLNVCDNTEDDVEGYVVN